MFALGAVLVVGLGLVVRDTMRRSGRFGINLRRVVCPSCETPAPVVRKPANERQAMWGGYTCRGCGCELDKWGRAIEPT